MNNKSLVAIAIMLVFVVPIGLGFLLNMEDVEQRSIVENNAVDITPELINGSVDSSIRYTGPNNNSFAISKTTYPGVINCDSLPYVEISTTPSSNPYYDDWYPSGIAIEMNTVSVLTWHDIPSTVGINYAVVLDDRDDNLRIYYTDGSVETRDYNLGGSDFISIFVYGSMLVEYQRIGGVFQDPVINPSVLKIQIGQNPGYANFNQTISEPTQSIPGLYGHPAYGWKIYSNVPDSEYMYWFNSFINQSISLMIDLGAAGTAHTITVGPLTIAQDAAGTVTYGIGNTDNTLGKYRYLNLIYDFDHFTDDYNNVTWTINGISKWPAMGATPNVLIADNLKTHESSPRTTLEFGEPGTKITAFRVDSTQIRDSSVNVIQNGSYDAKDKFPASTGYTIQIDSALVYGSSIAFAGHTYTITDGQITVNGIKYDVVGSKFTSIYDADTSRWNNLINGSSIGSSASNGTITFNGISSMEVSQLTAGYHVDTKSTQWVPGHFAFNVSDYALIGLITSIAAFVILGMAGIRSGGKVLWLAAICGGAAIIFITLI